MPQIPGTDLTVSALCLGGNVFGWTADEATSAALLDRFADATPSTEAPFVDTAESYGKGRSEEILGAWMAARGARDRVVVATKASPLDKEHPLSAAAIRTAAEGSLRRLRTDRIDLYYAHYDDGTTPLEETLQAFDELVQAGKVRYVAASNYSATRLTEALDTSERLGLTRYAALQPHYNLMERPAYEAELRDVVAERGLGVLPYYALARGLLTGKYRAGEPVDSPRAKGAAVYVGERGDRVLAALQEVAQAHGVPGAAVALRWLADQPTVVAPIASGRSVEQLADLLPMQDLVLTDDERQLLTDASS
ncbi:aldo/keto reductase [Geodermatophilus sabuli]|uniref:Predicted oxidoreductase n=1 Tax=Geodermatophilus sabuli TaxID=1564158 RepID=A0A285EII0_9ACTN|nr:aldo/keto reductase [Geodermatophilus sabuli]MBB3086806.1 aryl-alcohol dehydrogenase-like predicted oxidoreductase [Geodermatophilus sabuli]SNX98820.1 Predicted oxidoreductase [Geodermatophilus sabuli]